MLEPPTSSIFWVADGALRTTALAEGVLASITRDRVMQAVPGVEEGAWTLDQVKEASEAFLASTTRELQAVASIDGVALAAAPGPRTGEAQAAFAAARDAELEAAGPAPDQREEAGMDFNLTDEQKLISETAREFADREILPRVRENDRAERFDRELATQARRGRLPRPDPRRKVRRPQPRLHRLRADRRGRSAAPTPPPAPSSRCRPRWSASAIAEMGHRGAEAALAAAALLRRGRSAASA